MQSTYLNTVTSGTTPASVINPDGRAIVLRKIFVGNPVAGGSIVVFTENNALANNTTQIAFNNTYPGSFSTFAPTLMWDFRGASTGGQGSVEDDGITLTAGGSLSISQAMQLTIIWDYAQG